MYKIGKKQNYENRKNKPNFNDSIKHQLIDYIYSTVDLSQFKYEMLEYKEDMPKLFDNKYHLTANFSGTNCLLIFTKIRDKFQAFTIDRKTLSYSKDRVDPNKVDLKHVAVELDTSIYKGTILDGVLVKTDGTDQFIISDVYTFKGSDYSNVDLEMKMFEVKTYLESTDPQLNTLKNRHKFHPELELSVNRLYPLKDIEKFVDKVVPKFKDCKIRGLCFYPEISGTKLIYLFGNEKRGVTNESSNKTTVIKKSELSGKKKSGSSDSDFNGGKLTKYKFVSSTSEPQHAILEMKGTDTVDIYRLYSVEKIKKDKRTMLRRKKMGIAYIPTTERSQWCQSTLSKSKKNSVLVKCLFHNSKGKWEPIEVDNTKKFPTFFSDIEIEIMEISDSEDE